MGFVTFTSILAVFLTYLSKYKGLKKLYNISFVLVTIIACVHYNFGTDYPTYYEIFLRVNQSYDISSLSFASDLYVEPGWAFINYIFSLFGVPLGFFLMVAVLSIIQNAIYYKLIKNYVTSNFRWFAMAIYLFSSTLYILNFSMMRQGFAVSLVAMALMFLCEKRFVLSILMNVFAALIHTSALIFLPFLLIRKLKLHNTTFILFILWSLFFVFLLLSPVVASVLTYFMHLSFFSGYLGYINYGTSSLGLGFILQSVPYLLITYMLINKRNYFSYNIVLMATLMFVAFVMTPFVVNISLLGRVFYYFTVFSVVVIPNFYLKCNLGIIKYFAIFIYFFMLVFDYLDFFDPSHWSYEGYKTFNTIFEAL